MSESKNTSLAVDDPWYLYIVECCDSSYYVGITNNVEKRINLHNQGKGAIYLHNKLPVILKYSEIHTNKSSARKREIQIKGWSRNKKEQLIKGVYTKI